MNYAGKFDAAIFLDGQGSRSPAAGHIDFFSANAHGHVPDGAIVIADPNLIFHGEFKRAGLDLVLSHDGRDVVVHDYFRGDKRAAIASPDGAHLTGDIVSALTGYVQVAQTAPGAAATAQVIGHVTKLTGSATAIRNGVSVILNNGDNVEKGDVVATGSDSTLGITFIDGTVFGLSSNARMVLNEMVYDPNGSNNSSLLSLVAGTITFVAGETAKHGDMKIDTPVATMGIRGTAVLTEINFVVPAGGGDPQPQANFQVLVEPNGTTGSYILFDKLTLLPIATVNQAGQMIQISGGNVSVTNALLSPDVQKLITDVFTLKFTDNNTNTKLTTNFTDTITQNGNVVVIKTDTGATATATFTNPVNNNTGPGQSGPDKGGDRFPGPPHATSLDANGNVTSSFTLKEHASATADRADATGDSVGPDTVTFRINFVDQNLGDRPTVSVDLGGAPNYVYMDAGQHDVTGSLSALQKLDIAATQIQINVAADAGNSNNGSATLTYTIPDHVFDFLAAGETLTLTYMVRVNDNFAVNPESTYIPITITITGTNDKPVITTSVPTITFSGGTSVPGGPLTTEMPTSGKLTFTDVDLTDTHTVGVAAFSAVVPGGTVPDAISKFLSTALSVSIATGDDSTGSGAGTIDWSLANIPAYLADFIPKGEVLTVTYIVRVTDSQGATSDQTITVAITGTDAPAVVWIATNHPSGGFWKDGANWETGLAPTINDDVIVITDQLHGLTPSYPVTIDVAAFGKSLTMDDYDATANHKAPELINHGTLKLAGTLTLNADAKFTNAADGTVLVGGAIDVETITRTNGAIVINTATIANAGTLTLAAGGTIATLTTIANSGTIDLTGGTLTLKTGIANAGGTVQVESGAALVADTVTLDGGTVSILGTLELDGTSLIENGTLNNWGVVNVKGAAEFANEIVNNKASGTIEVWPGHALTIDHGSVVNNSGNVNVDANGKLTVNGASIDGGVPLHGPGAGEHEGGADAAPHGGTVTNSGELDLTGNAVLSNGVLKNNGTLNVRGIGNALNGEAVTNAGNGAVTVDATGKLTVHGATITGGTVTDNGEIDLTGGAVLSGGALQNNATFKLGGTGNALDAETVTNASTGTIEVLTNGALTIDLGSVVANTGSSVTVDGSAILTLNGAKITGGTINGTGTIDVTGTGATIDGGATLSTSNVTADAELTLNGVMVVGATITNLDVVKVDADNQLNLNAAKLKGGTLTVSGTLDSSGSSEISDASISISNTGLIEAIGGLLTLATATSAAIVNAGTIQANSAELDINGEAVSNTGTLAAVNGGTLKLIGMTATNAGGTVSDQSGSTIDLAGATIDGGTVTIAGTLVSADTSAIDNANITNTGTITVTAGTLTIDPATLHTIVNHNLIQASGGELDISGEDISNTADLKAVNHGTLKLVNLTVSDSVAGAVRVDSQSKLYLSGVSINGGSLSNTGNLFGVTGLNTVTGGVINTGTIEVQGGTLDLSGGITGLGTLIVDDTATLQLGGADVQTVTFAGGANTLQLDKVSGQSFTGTITALASQAGTFTVTGGADITTSSGDALDVTSTGGTSGPPAAIVLTPIGNLTGAANGVAVTQNGVGNVSLTATGNIKGSNGHGIWLSVGANGGGGITVNDLSGKATGTGTNSEGILVENLNAANAAGISITQLGGAAGGAYGIDATTWGDGNVTIDAGGNITGSSVYGVRARSYGSGDIAVTIEPGSVVTSGSSGIVAVNRATSIDASKDSTITVNAYGTINSGSSPNLSGNSPAGIQAGYTGATNGSSINAGVNGSVVVNNHANITAAAGYGIHAYNYGNGDVTVTNDATITADAGYGIGAFDHGGGNVSVTNEGAATGSVALGAVAVGHGNVTILNDGTLTATGSAGIVVTQNDTGETGNPVATGSTHITNNGSIVGASGHYAIFVQENTTGKVLIDNAGTIGPAVASLTSTTYAVAESGGAITISNSGHINGNISVASAAFNNKAGGTWTFAGISVFGIESSIVNAGEIDLHDGASIASADGVAFAISNTGKIESWGSTSITGAIGGAGTVEVNSGTLTLAGSLSGGTVSVDADAVLDLAGATITGGTVTISGTLESTGTSAINGANFTNNGTIEIISGTLTIDPTTVTNNLFMEINGAGAVLDISGDPVNNLGTLEAINGGALKLSSLTVTNSGTMLIGSGSVMDLSNVTIHGGTITDNGTIDVTGSSAINGAALNGGIVIVEHGSTLTVGTLLSGTAVRGTTFAGDHATINVSGANQNFSLAADYDTVTSAGSSANITISGGHNIVTAAGSNGSFLVSGDHDVLNLYGSGDTATITGTNDVLSLFGSNGTVNFTSNNTALSVIASHDTVNVSGNNDSLTVVGSGDTINITGNNSSVSVTASSATIQFVGEGDTLTTIGSNNTFVLGSGKDMLVFKFDDVGADTVKNFDVANDTIEFSSSVFATVRDAMRAAQDDGHGNVVITLEAHESITLKGVHLSQLTTHDFAIV